MKIQQLCFVLIVLFYSERTEEEATGEEVCKDGSVLCTCLGGGVFQGRSVSYLRGGGGNGEELPGENEMQGQERGEERNPPGWRTKPQTQDVLRGLHISQEKEAGCTPS